jgi:hypothetical protein
MLIKHFNAMPLHNFLICFQSLSSFFLFSDARPPFPPCPTQTTSRPPAQCSEGPDQRKEQNVCTCVLKADVHARQKVALIMVQLLMSARFSHMQQTVCGKIMQDFRVGGKYHPVPHKHMYEYKAT